MKENTESVSRYIAVNGRPSWPYEDWKYNDSTDAEKERECRIDIQTNSSAKEPHVDASSLTKTSSDKEFENVFEPDHWHDDLDGPVAKTVPLYQLLSECESDSNCTALEESKAIFNVALEMMNKTAQELSVKYKVFKECYVLPVGSFMENTKIGRPDEFDFSVILSYFENFDKLDSLFSKECIVLLNDLDFVSLVNDITTNYSAQTLIENFQTTLKQLWTLYMLDYIPEGWNLPKDASHDGTHESGIAGTYHMFRQADGFVLDMDVCFWTPVSKSTLQQMRTKLEQADYLMKHCLNEDNTIYAILSRDYDVNVSLNVMRFAMSLKEREKLNENGKTSNRLKCYKIVKCIAKYFIPRLQKRDNCKRCHDSLVPSFCLKNIVLYMVENYPSNDMWTDEYLPNRVLEVFSILNFCMKTNSCDVSAYFTPYMIRLHSYSKKYHPGKRLLVDSNNHWVGLEPLETPCLLPDGIEQFEALFCHDHYSKVITQNYFRFLHQSDWRLPDVIDRLNEMLIALREAGTDERRYYEENPGCLCFNYY